MVRPRPHRRAIFALLLACAPALGSFLVASGAEAQTASLIASGITRTTSNRPAEQQRLWINRADCLANDAFNFPLTISGFISGITLEVWVSEGSVDCKELNNRSGTNQQCWNVGTFSGNQTLNPILTVSARDIIGKHRQGGGPGQGTIEDCSAAATTDAPLPLQVFFLVQRGQEVLTSPEPYVSISYDLRGPVAPTGVKAGIGENILVLDWALSGSQDIRGYNFYCDPPNKEITGPAPTPLPKAACAGSGGASASGSSGSNGVGLAGTGGGSGASGSSGGASGSTSGGASGGALGGSGGASAGGSPSSSGGSDGGLPFAPDPGGTAGTASGGTTGTGTGGSAAASGTGTTSGGSGSKALPACVVEEPTTCPTSILIPGEVPDERYLCGSVTGLSSASGIVKDLKNFQVTSVGIAAIDTVGNIGPLSKVVCRAPNPVDDFYKVYREAGGRAGGGYCSAGEVGRASTLAPFGLALSVAATRLVRRRKTR